MHVALLTRRYDRSGGGTERDLVITADCLERAGHRVTIFAAEVRGDRDQKKLRFVKTPPIGRALKLWRFAHLAPGMARREGADLIVSFARTIGADVMRSGGGAHASYVQAARRWQGMLGASAMRDSPYHRMQMLIERRAFASQRLKLTIAVAEVVRRDLIGRFGLRPDKVETLYNGVDTERFHPAAANDERARIQRELNLPNSAPVVIFVGNGFARKGLGFMLEAWPQLKSGACLIVAGSDRGRASVHYEVARVDKHGRRAVDGSDPPVSNSKGKERRFSTDFRVTVARDRGRKPSAGSGMGLAQYSTTLRGDLVRHSEQSSPSS